MCRLRPRLPSGLRHSPGWGAARRGTFGILGLRWFLEVLPAGGLARSPFGRYTKRLNYVDLSTSVALKPRISVKAPLQRRRDRRGGVRHGPFRGMSNPSQTPKGSIAGHVKNRHKEHTPRRTEAGLANRRERDRQRKHQARIQHQALEVDHHRDEETIARLRRELDGLKEQLADVQSSTLVDKTRHIAVRFGGELDVPPDGPPHDDDGASASARPSAPRTDGTAATALVAVILQNDRRWLKFASFIPTLESPMMRFRPSSSLKKLESVLSGLGAIVFGGSLLLRWRRRGANANFCNELSLAPILFIVLCQR